MAGTERIGDPGIKVDCFLTTEAAERIRERHRATRVYGAKVSTRSEVATAPVVVPDVQKPISVSDVQITEYKGQRVVTFVDIDRVHGREPGTAGRNFREHRQRFVEGTHYHLVSADEIRRHKIVMVSDNYHHDVILITEKGYMKLVKSFNDELAWDVQELLVDNYFRCITR